MTIINFDDIYNKYFKDIADKFQRKSNDINEIVIHGTAGGDSAKAILKWMLDGEREKEYRKGIGLFHTEIDLNGDVYNILSPLFWCYHSSSGKHDKMTIGIELINTKPDNKGLYMYEQYESLFKMIDAYLGVFPIKRICGHGYNKKTYSGEYKECPGSMFEWGKLQKKFNLKEMDKECYQI
jgi:hypothetical protein